MKHKIAPSKVTANVTAQPPGHAKAHSAEYIPSAQPSLQLATSFFPLPSVSSHLPAILESAPSAANTAPNTALETAPEPGHSTPLHSAPDRFLQIRIDSLKEKQRADSFFNSLNAEQVRKFIGWIGEDDNKLLDIWRRVKAPAPEGFGMNVSMNTIRRLRDAWRAEDLAEISNSALDVIIDMEDKTDLNQAARIQTAMNQMLSETAFSLMRTHPASPLLKELLGNIQKLTDLELKRQKLQLEREKLLSKTASAPARHDTTQLQPVQHHRVDLNFVPPKRDPAIVASSVPEPTLKPPQQLPSPAHSIA